MNKYITLNNGCQMPVLGLGTWKSNTNEVAEAVKYALLDASYDHIDGAAIYLNEKEIGEVYAEIFNSGKRRREDVFITSKLWNTEHKKEDVLKACKKTLSDLNLEYLDLYLMHWGVAIPHNTDPQARAGVYTEQLDENGRLITIDVSIQETWQAMEELVSAGLVKSIGVSNFTGPMLFDLLSYAKIKPVVNQIEFHPYLQQKQLVDFCKYKDIVLTAYSPLGSPGNHRQKGFDMIIDNKIVVAIANKHKKTVAQVLIRFVIEQGLTVIPKSVNKERIKENADVFDFILDDEDMGQLFDLDRHLRYANATNWWKIPYFD